MESLREIVSGFNQLKGKITVVVIGQIFTGVGTFVGVRLLTEIISPETFGQYKLVLSGASLGAGVLVRPVIQFAMREFHDARENGIESEFARHMRGVFFQYTLLVVAGLTLILSATAVSKIGWAPLLFAVLVVGLGALVEYERAMFITRDEQTAAILLNNYGAWIPPVVIVLFVWIFRESLEVVMAGAIIPLAAVCLFLAFRYAEGRNSTRATQIGLDTKKTLGKAFTFGWPIAIVGLLSWVVHECDRFFLDYYHDDFVVGTYSAAYGLVSAPFVLVSGVVAQLAYPIVFREAASKTKARSSFGRILTVNIVVCALGVSLVAVFGSYLAEIGLGARYRESASRLFIWVALGYGFNGVAVAFELMAYGDKRTRTVLVAFVAAAVANLIGNYLLIPAYGAMGAAKATMISMFVYLLVMLLFMVKNNFGRESGGAPA